MPEFTLKQWRLARELSQEKMADLLHIHVNTYRSWEEQPENISIKDANSIAEILNVPFDKIIFLQSNSKKNGIAEGA